MVVALEKPIYTSGYAYSSIDLHKLSLLEKTIVCCLFSAYVKGEKPLSLLIATPPDMGKSMTLAKFSKNRGVITINQATRYGLANRLFSENPRSFKHLIIPDLSSILHGYPGVVADNLSFLSALVEEGIADIQSFYTKYHFDPPVNLGVLTAVTDRDLEDKRLSLSRIGFISRFIPFSYKYDKMMVEGILNYLYKGEDLKEDFVTLDFPAEPVEVACADKFVRIFGELLNSPSVQTHGFRFIRHIRGFLKSHALAQGRKEVTGDDVDEVLKVVTFINLKYAPIM